MVRTAQMITILILTSAWWAQASEPLIETIVPGLEHRLLVEGETAASPGYRILLGIFEHQSDAAELLERLDESGNAAFPESEGSDYWVVTPVVSDIESAEAMKRRLMEQGFSGPFEIQEVSKDPSHVSGPWRIHVLIADPEKIDVQVAHSTDAAIGLETTSDLAIRRGALAAINGGYYRMKGLLAGDSQGVLQIDGAVLSEPDRGRGAVGFFENGGVTQSVFGRLTFAGAVVLEDGTEVAIDGINRPRKPSEIVLYTSEFHRTTLTAPGGVEVAIDGGRIAGIRENEGSTEIPCGGSVVSIGPERIAEVAPRLRRGSSATVKIKLISLLPDPEGRWDRAEGILGGGPLLLWQGRRLEEPEKESISTVFFRARHPRTAAGVRADGTLVFVTVDGRRPGVSVGMSIPELTDLMVRLGCVSAVNLDGGGSTTMVVEGHIVNVPTDSNGARANGDAILLFPKKATPISVLREDRGCDD